MKLFLLTLAIIQSLKTANEIYDTQKSSVQRFNQGNFNNTIKNGRSKGDLFIIHFYKPNDGKSFEFS